MIKHSSKTQDIFLYTCSSEEVLSRMYSEVKTCGPQLLKNRFDGF